MFADTNYASGSFIDEESKKNKIMMKIVEVRDLVFYVTDPILRLP